jgi:hypothetical protein
MEPPKGSNMKKLSAIVILLVELAILAGLLWACSRLSDLGIQSIPMLIVLIMLPLLCVIHWGILRERHIENKTRLKLAFLTGPSIFLCILLTFCLSLQLKVIGIGRSSKNAMHVAEEKGVPVQYWRICNDERVESELLIYSMLLASLCIIYGNRYSVSRSQNMKHTYPKKGKDNTS